MSLISRLRAVVAGDDYLDGDLDDLVYEDEQQEQDQRATHADGGALATIADSNPFDLGDSLPGSNVIGMPGISTAAASSCQTWECQAPAANASFGEHCN